MTTPPMRTPDYPGFTGYTHQRVTGLPAHLADLLARDPGRGGNLVWNHFHTEGQRHADLITREFCAAARHGLDISPSSTLADIGSLEPPIDVAKLAYAAGVGWGLTRRAAKLTGIAFVDEMGFSTDAMATRTPALEWAAGLSAATCREIENALRELARYVTTDPATTATAALTTPPTWIPSRLDHLRDRAQSLKPGIQQGPDSRDGHSGRGGPHGDPAGPAHHPTHSWRVEPDHHAELDDGLEPQ